MRDSQPPRSAGNRFLQPWPVREMLCSLAVGAVLFGGVVLSPPVAAALLAHDARTLGPGFVAALEQFRLAACLVGLFALVAAWSPRWAELRLPIRRGTVCVVVAVPLLLAVLAEGLFRVRGLREWGSAFRTPLGLADMHHTGEQSPRPGVYLTRVLNDFRPGDKGRTVTFTIQAFGVRGRGPRHPGPAQGARVICVGGSTTFGYMVTDGEEWPAVLERLLQSVGPVEVVNAGRPGATTWRDYQYLRDRLLPLQPDVVIFYEGFNDMWRGVRRHAAPQEDYGRADVGVPAVESPFRVGPEQTWPLRWSFLTARLGKALEWRFEPSTALPEPKPEALFHPAIVGLYEDNLSAMVRLTRQKGAVPVVTTFAGCDAAGRGAEETRRCLRYVREEVPPLDGTLARRAMDLYRERTRAVAEKEGAYLVDLARLVPHDPRLFADTVHFTPEGERRLAQALATGLLQDPEVSRRLRAPRPH
ncbi:MAG: SGNH/GDSL hydrolase family protein [Polyangiaceae bacterium]|nr:SGNH/GDSL hydrolase family protein [Polyangiaceae bacterium]